MEFLEASKLAGATTRWVDRLGIDLSEDIELAAPALLVVDMQKDFLCDDGLLPVWGGPAIVANVGRAANAFRQANQPVIFTRHIYERPESDGGLTARWWNLDSDSQLLREGTWHSELHDDIAPSPGDRVLAKRRYSAFFGTDLELLLRTSGVREVVIAGVATNICCEATAHDAFFRDFSVFVLLDGTGGTDERSHLATLRNLASFYGRSVSTDQVMSALRRK